MESLGSELELLFSIFLSVTAFRPQSHSPPWEHTQ